MTIASSQHVQGPKDRFEEQAVVVMRDLRSAFLGLQQGLPTAVTRAADLERALGLRTTLAWQVYRVATSDNPLAAGAHVPGSAAARQVINSARAAGVAEERLRAVDAAMTRFEALVQEHAGDREMFLTMVGSLVAENGQAIDSAARRQTFRGNSQLWGVQVQTQLWCSLYHPGRSPEVLDSASIFGLHGIRRLRAGAPLRLAGHRVLHENEGGAMPQGIDAKGGELTSGKGPTLLLEFCSQPCPELDNREVDGYVYTYVREGPLGNAGARSLFLADVARDIKWQPTGGEPNELSTSVANTKPAAAIVLDTLIHRTMFGTLTPMVRVNGSLDRLGEPDPDNFLHEETLPVAPEVRNLGAGVAALPTPHVPRYAEMVESVCRRLGWNANEFEVFRCVVEYPILSSVLSVRFNLPEEGNW